MKMMTITINRYNYHTKVGSMRGSLALMAGGLVLSFLGLLTCLLLVGISFTSLSCLQASWSWSSSHCPGGRSAHPAKAFASSLAALPRHPCTCLCWRRLLPGHDPPPSQYHLDLQALHFTVLAEKKDTLRACLALFPVVAGIFFTFLWVADHDSDLGDNHGQLARQ